MNQHNHLQDPLVFIRLQAENAFDQGDLSMALRMCQWIDSIQMQEMRDRQHSEEAAC